MRNRCRTGLAALLGLSVLAVAARADEEKISIEELPSAVKKAVETKFPEAKIRGAAKEVEDGKTTYEVELTVEGRAVDVALNAKGKILEIEKEIPADKLPGAVKKKLAAKYPGATIEKAEELTKGEDGPVRYEVLIKAEVVFNAKGKVVGTATEENEDDEDDKPAAKAKKKEKEEDDDDEDDDDDKPAAKAKKKEHRDDDKPAAKAKKKKEKEEDEDDDEDEGDDDREVKGKRRDKD
jgi:Putative beta-lactamase-inhibitor-like, PepSY-like